MMHPGMGGPHRIQLTLTTDSVETPVVTLILTAVAGWWSLYRRGSCEGNSWLRFRDWGAGQVSHCPGGKPRPGDRQAPTELPLPSGIPAVLLRLRRLSTATSNSARLFHS